MGYWQYRRVTRSRSVSHGGRFLFAFRSAYSIRFAEFPRKEILENIAAVSITLRILRITARKTKGERERNKERLTLTRTRKKRISVCVWECRGRGLRRMENLIANTFHSPANFKPISSVYCQSQRARNSWLSAGTKYFPRFLSNGPSSQTLLPATFIPIRGILPITLGYLIILASVSNRFLLLLPFLTREALIIYWVARVISISDPGKINIFNVQFVFFFCEIVPQLYNNIFLL